MPLSLRASSYANATTLITSLRSYKPSKEKPRFAEKPLLRTKNFFEHGSHALGFSACTKGLHAWLQEYAQIFLQKPQKPHSSIKVPRSTNDTIYLFFLVCEHPDKNVYLISQFSYRVFLILSWKNPASDFVEPVLARQTENKLSSVLAYSRLSAEKQYIQR